MNQIDTDKVSGAEVWRLSDDLRPTDNIYGEQPYGSADGTRLALRHYATPETDSGLSILDLNDGSSHPIIETAPRFPAFHGCNEYLYCQQQQGDQLILCRWQPRPRGNLASASARGSFHLRHRFWRSPALCRVCAQRGGTVPGAAFRPGQRQVADADYQRRPLLQARAVLRDGQNLVMIQANSPDVSRVGLGALTLARQLTWFAADEPHTTRPSGHETWIGAHTRVFFSTRWDDEQGNLWTGSLSSGRHAHLVFTATVHDGQQSSHAHPYLTADNRWAVYTSNRDGHSQVYGARLPEGLLASLD
jgi:Tol biopolymer transport system component